MSDFGDEEYHNMLCVEAGSVSERVSLAAGSDIVFSQQIIVSDHNSKMWYIYKYSTIILFVLPATK